MTTDSTPSSEELRRRAAEAGLTRLTPAHLEELARGLATLQKQVSRRWPDLAPGDEPAHVFRAGPEA